MQIREVQFEDKDLPLRADVSFLGQLVGQVLTEQGGDSLFQLVEHVRTCAIQRREGVEGAEGRLFQALSGLELAEVEQLVRSFSTYFQVVNLAEKVHRIRRARHYLREGAAPQRGSLNDAIGELKEAGVAFDDLSKYLCDLLNEPVFTAHPTEATRRTILEKEQFMIRRLVERLDPSRTPQEERMAEARVRAAVTSAWQTQLYPQQRPTVQDECEHVLFYLTDVIYRVIPPFYETLRDALTHHYGEQADGFRMPVMLRFGSWVGGDMDGNPNVGADTIYSTLQEHRRLVIRLYAREVESLARFLSQSLSEITVSDAVTHRLEKYSNQLPKEVEQLPKRHANMPYRQLLTLMHKRLLLTQSNQDGGYGSSAEFLNDIQLIRVSLESNQGEHAGLFGLKRLQMRARTFGFHLATLDLRQDALLHREVISAILRDEQWLDTSAEDRTKDLTQLLADAETPDVEDDRKVDRCLDVFRAINDCRGKYGNNALGLFIVSMTQGADDVLSVLFLAAMAGLTNGDGQVPLDVAPLLETVDDLHAGPGILTALLENPVYREHLKARGDKQIIMVGYSDSNKDGGIVSSRWALQEAQTQLEQVASSAGIQIVFFHGRGGTVSRGGGNTREAILSSPPNTIQGYFRVTEQGEMINQKFGVRRIALRNLEQSTSAMMLADLKPDLSQRTGKKEREMMNFIAETARAHYRKLVYETPEFIPYFRNATPIDVIERMAIGSRPSSRRDHQGIESLRAIPWVFSWAQTRTGLPGTYGVGTALRAAVEQFGLAEMQGLLEHWRFFRTLITDVEMVLARSDLAISEAYAVLAPESSRFIFDQVKAEMTLCEEQVLEIKQQQQLLDDREAIQRSIWLRNPYTDPMNLLQIDLLTQWRAEDRKNDDLLRALFASVNGIAAGIQSTG